jgi:hypothetical protein
MVDADKRHSDSRVFSLIKLLIDFGVMYSERCVMFMGTFRLRWTQWMKRTQGPLTALTLQIMLNVLLHEF